MASPSLALPGVLFVGEDERARLVAHLGPAAGWMIPKGILGWSTEVSVVAREALTEQVRRDAKIVMPEEQIPPAKMPLTHQAAQRSPLVSVSSRLTQKLIDAGIRVHTVGADRVTSSFYYIAEGGGEGPVRIEGDLVAAVGAMLGDRADNAAIERVLDGLVDRLLRSLSKDRVTEVALELAAALPRAAADGTGTQDVDLESFEKELSALVGASEKYTSFLQEIANKISDTNERKVDIPLFGDARKISQGPFELTIGDRKVSLVTHERWIASGPLTEPKPVQPAQPAPAPASQKVPAPAPVVQKAPEPKAPEPKAVTPTPAAAAPAAAPAPAAATATPAASAPPANMRPLAAPLQPPRPGSTPGPKESTPAPTAAADKPKAETPKPEPAKEPTPAPAAAADKPKVETPKPEPAKEPTPAPAAATTKEPEAKKAEEPKTAEAPEAKKAEEPEAKKAEEPEAKKAEEPEAKKAEEPEAKKAEEPKKAEPTDAPKPEKAEAKKADKAEKKAESKKAVVEAERSSPEATPRDSRLATTQKTKRAEQGGIPWLWILIGAAVLFAGYWFYSHR